MSEIANAALVNRSFIGRVLSDASMVAQAPWLVRPS
jgi:hypothetical protein